jgi:RNA polymerase sigma factor (sigma-70 family)
MSAVQTELARKISICYARYYNYVVNSLRKIIYDEETCKEIVQECFLRIFSKSIILDPDGPHTINFLVSTAKNMAIDYLRRKRTERTVYKEKYYLEFPSGLDSGLIQPFEETIFGGEINDIVASSMRKFHEVKRYVFKEIVIRGKGVAHVSNKSAMSRYKVKKYCDEVTDRLREDLAEYR